MLAQLALVGATIYTSPGDPPVRNGVVLIEDGKILAAGARSAVRVPPGADSLDCSGLTITAGLWNSHVHFFERKWSNAASIPAPELARQFEDMLTRFGFTGAFDLSSLWENTRKLRERIESGEVAGPHIRSTGEGIIAANPGIPPDSVLNFMGVVKTPLNEVADARQAAAAARKLIDQGVDAIKLFISGPSKASIPQDAIADAVSEAHRAGKPVFVHPNSPADVLAAVRGGADIIGHTTPSGAWTRELIEEMKSRRVALTPTLTIWRYYARHDRISAQDATTRTITAQLRAWIESGGAVLFGSDLGAIDYDPAEEYALMSAAGMNFAQILASLTTAPAERFGEGKRLGRVAAGYEADLAIFRGDPAENLRALTDVRYTLRAGRIIYGRR
jgi:imidazolonepropionase-like amidohydrolase